MAAAPPEAAPRWPLLLSLCVCAALASFVWVTTVATGDHLLHFDAKAHLVVARRVLDSLTPGWLQLGAIWLPLPHILNVLPAQSDLLYHTGLFASALGFMGFLAGVAALGLAAARGARDVWAGAVAVAVLAWNPGWLYLQATPLTEPLFLGLVSGLAFYLVRWFNEGRTSDLVKASLLSGLATLVRYEAWALAAAWMALVLGVPLPGCPRPTRPQRAWALGLGLVGPIVLYGLHSWAATGIPFHAVGTENLTETRGHIVRSASLLAIGVARGFGIPLALAGAAALIFLCLSSKTRSDPLLRIALALLAPGAVTFTAYLAGHPPKARYPLLLAPSLALLLAAATRGRRRLQALALLLAVLQSPVLPRPLPVLAEAIRDRRDVVERTPVVAELRRQYRGGRILASMGSLAPVLFELGLPLREVVHEGNGNWWADAVVDPGRGVAWIMVAEGDALDQVRSYRPRFPEGFVPALGFGRVAIYRRAEDLAPRTASGEGDHWRNALN